VEVYDGLPAVAGRGTHVKLRSDRHGELACVGVVEETDFVAF
jgi:hypothetical protein